MLHTGYWFLFFALNPFLQPRRSSIETYGREILRLGRKITLPGEIASNLPADPKNKKFVSISLPGHFLEEITLIHVRNYEKNQEGKTY